jgi:ABC-type multidrug transport system permease subunit
VEDDSVLLHLWAPRSDHRGVHAALRSARAGIGPTGSPTPCFIGALDGAAGVTLVDSQALAFLIGLLISLLPTFVLSGFIFPIASMPRPIQYITVIVPARYFLVALRGIVLKGVGFGPLAPQFAALGTYAFVVLALASVRLSKERG